MDTTQRRRPYGLLPATVWLMGTVAAALAQQAQAPPVATGDTTVFDPDGTARITRVVPVPKTVSPEAQARLATGATWAPGPNSPENPKLIEKARAMYPVKEEEKTIAGVTVRYFTPPNIPANKRNRLLINLHGGGFQSDASSLLESIPIAR